MNTVIKIEASINADVKKVWDFYNNPKHIVNWNFAIDTWCCPSSENDLRKGGKLKSRMEAKDGSFGFDFEAIYDEVIEFSKIQYTIGDGRKVITEFKSGNGQTLVTTEFEAENQNPTELQRDGWQAILNNFKAYVEKN